MEHRDLVIIGSGPAGYTAAIYAARAGLSPLCIEGFAAGGQLLLTGRVENFPGFPDGVEGPELMQQMRDQAERFGAEFLLRDVSRLDLSGSPFLVEAGDAAVHARAVILATGACSKQLGLESEAALQTRGVAYCAVCDGAFFAGQRVAVIGGGNAAVDTALSMSKLARKVLLVHRREELRATKVMQGYVAARANIHVLKPYAVDEILGEDAGRVTGLRLRHAATGEERVEELEGVFVSIGHTPNTEIFRPWVDLDVGGYVIVEPGSTRTNIPGIFAAGDVLDHVYRQAVTAAGSGCMAALDAERWLTHTANRPTTEIEEWAA
jgi:thioredoxin reductase (NADPH)